MTCRMLFKPPARLLTPALLAAAVSVSPGCAQLEGAAGLAGQFKIERDGKLLGIYTPRTATGSVLLGIAEDPAVRSPMLYVLRTAAKARCGGALSGCATDELVGYLVAARDRLVAAEARGEQLSRVLSIVKQYYATVLEDVDATVDLVEGLKAADAAGVEA